MEKLLEHLQEARKITKTIDHLIYVTFPLVKDKRLLLKAVVESKKSIAHCINAILQYEYLHKRIKLCKDSNENFKTFSEKCTSKYEITNQEVELIVELFSVVKSHEQSPFEFARDDRIIILSESMNQKILTIEKVKEFLLLTKNVLGKTISKICNA